MNTVCVGGCGYPLRRQASRALTKPPGGAEKQQTCDSHILGLERLLFPQAWGLGCKGHPPLPGCSPSPLPVPQPSLEPRSTWKTASSPWGISELYPQSLPKEEHRLALVPTLRPRGWVNIPVLPLLLILPQGQRTAQREAWQTSGGGGCCPRVPGLCPYSPVRQHLLGIPAPRTWQAVL